MAFIYDLTDTWNAGGTTFNAIKMNVTDTASAAASKLITVQVGGAEKFGVRKDGLTYVAGSLGVGTSSPVKKLHVRGDALIQPDAVADINLVLRKMAAQTGNILEWQESSGAKLGVIDTSGNVGIGTSSPGARFHVQTDSNKYIQIKNAAHSGYAAPVAALTFSRSDGNSDGSALFADNINLVSSARGAIAFATGGFGTYGGTTERMRIDASGNVGIGTSSPGGKLSVAGRADFGVSTDALMYLTNNANALRGVLKVDASGFNVSASGGGVPLILGTSATERMRITSGGIVRPGADNTQSLGEASFRWSTVFAGTGTINISDEREKVWRGAMTEAEMRAAKRLLAELGMFQFTDSIEEKGEDARLHFGVRAQKAFAILEDEGLEWWRYAWCCHDKWDEITEPVMEEVTVEKTRTVEVPEEREVEKTETVMEPVFDEETGEQVMDENGEPVMTEIEQTFTVTETVMVEVEETYEETEQRDTGEVRVVREAGDRYGIRADQLAYWLIAAQAEIQNDLDARLAKLETAQ